MFTKISQDSIKDTDIIIIQAIGKTKTLKRIDGLNVTCIYPEGKTATSVIEQSLSDLLHAAQIGKN